MTQQINTTIGIEETLAELQQLKMREPWWFTTDECDLMRRWNAKHSQPSGKCRFDTYTQGSIKNLAAKVNRRLVTGFTENGD